MRRLSLGAILLIIAVVLLTSACANESPTPKPTPTEDLQVAVFATEATTATPTTTTNPTPTAPPTLTPTAVVTTARAADEVAQKTTTVSGPPEFGFTRAPDENPLTGLTVDDEKLLKRRPIMVRVGNDPEARPQVGLNEADVVYEELVEWWVTRFTAIYLSQDVEMVAPIRSVRLINLQLAPQYQGAIAHSGGSDPVRFRLSKTNIVDLDEFFTALLYFYRKNEGWATRLAFNPTLARDYMADEGLERDPKLRGFVFNPILDLTDLPQEALGDALTVTIPYPSQTSEATWEYDEKNGRYLRSTTGEPMEDFEGNPISAANVIIYFAEHNPTDIVEDTNGATSVDIQVNGFGTAWLLRDGKILKGNWQTDGSTTPYFIFNDESPMPLKPGNTWISVVPLFYEIEIGGDLHTRLGDNESERTEPEATAETTATSAPTATLTPIGARATATPNTASPAESASANGCPVSEPVWIKPPDDSAVQGSPEYGYYFVNEDRSMWASAWWTGQEADYLRVSEDGLKVGWFRPAGATLEITGQRMDSQSPPLEAHIPCCYPTRFQATGLIFPTEGCWEVSAKAADSELSFVVWVEP